MIKIEVKEGKLPWIVGSGTIIFGILLGAAVMLKQDSTGRALAIGYLVIVLIIASGIWLCLDGRNRKLVVEDMTLSYSNWLGRKRIFSVDGIGYCKTALERNKDYLKIYDLQGEKICKIEYNMKNSEIFLQYLLDNCVKIECTKNSDLLLRSMLNTETICPEQIPEKVNAAYGEVKAMIAEWTKNNKKLGASWKIGIAEYPEHENPENATLENKALDEKECWEQKEYLAAIEGYLQKDGKYVMDKKNKAVMFSQPIVFVSESMQYGGVSGEGSLSKDGLKIRFLGSALEELSVYLETMAEILPVNRYHTEEILPAHELKELKERL